MTARFASPSSTLKSRFIWILSVKLCLSWTRVLKFWIEPGHLDGSPSNWKNSITGRHLDFYSNCNNLDFGMTISFSKKTVSFPSTNSSTIVSILWPGLFYAFNWIFCLSTCVRSSWGFHCDIRIQCMVFWIRAYRIHVGLYLVIQIFWNITWGRGSESFVIWVSAMWFKDKFRIWRNVKFTVVMIQITSGKINVGERFGLNWVTANAIGILMH